MNATVFSNDPTLRDELARVFRTAGVSLDVFDERDQPEPTSGTDMLVVDGRQHVTLAVAHVERLRALAPQA